MVYTVLVFLHLNFQMNIEIQEEEKLKYLLLFTDLSLSHQLNAIKSNDLSKIFNKCKLLYIMFFNFIFYTTLKVN